MDRTDAERERDKERLQSGAAGLAEALIGVCRRRFQRKAESLDADELAAMAAVLQGAAVLIQALSDSAKDKKDDDHVG